MQTPGQGLVGSSRAHGYAVLAGPSARTAAWSFAQKVYGSTRLRPGLSEPRARVFAGEAPGPDATAELRDLAETRDAIVNFGASSGADSGAGSRRLLASLAKDYSLEGVLVVVVREGEAPVVRLFSADAARFDAAELRARPGGALDWSDAVASLERLVPREAAPEPARPARLATPAGSEAKPFYASPWFWGAMGAAVAVGGAAFLATRDSSSGSIHLQMQVPR